MMRELRSLVEKWRAEAQCVGEWATDAAPALDACADELEEILDAETARGPRND